MRILNSQINQLEFSKKNIVLTSRPRMLFLELTRSCNLTCPMCRPELIAGHQFDMPAEILQKVREELFPYIECVDLRAFGESTLDNRMIPLTEELIANNITVNLYTNLVTRNPDYWAKLGQMPVNISISFEASTPELYNQTRRGAKFERFARHLHELTTARRASRSKENISFSITVSQVNLQELPLIVEFAAKHNIKTVKLNPITLEAEGHQYPVIGVGPPFQPLLQEKLNAATQLAIKYGIDLVLGASLDNAEDGGFDLCLHPWSYVVVSYNGDVIFCDHLIADQRAVLGNLSEHQFMEIWNNKAYRQIRKEHIHREMDRLKKCGIECDWCYKNRYADVETQFDNSFIPFSLTQNSNGE